MTADPTQAHVAKQYAHDAPLISCRFDPTGRFVYAGAQDNAVLRWNLENDGKSVLTGHDSWVRAFAFSPSGDVLITGGYDGRLVWWSALDDQPAAVRKVDAHQGWIRALSVSPDGQFVASCGNDLKVKVWRLADGSLVHDLAGHERHVYHIAFHPSGTHLATGDLTAKFIDWDLASGTKAREFTIASLTKYDTGFLADYGGPHSMAFTTDGQRLLAGGITNVTNAFAGVGNPIIVEIDWSAGKDAVTHLCKDNPNGIAWGLVWHPEGYVIGALGGQLGGRLAFWKPDQKDEFHSLNLGPAVRDLALHPDGIRLATPHFDHQCRIIRLAPKA